MVFADCQDLASFQLEQLCGGLNYLFVTYNNCQDFKPLT